MSTIKDRDLYPEVRQHVEKKEYSIITGARQVGKTTLAQKLFSELKQTVPDVFYISFENAKTLHEVNLDAEKFAVANLAEEDLLAKKDGAFTLKPFELALVKV